jgi:nucleoside-diphosphate-sugar epimerase
VVVGDLGPATVWDRALQDIDVVIHLAARTHIMQDAASDPLAEYRRVNVAATETLAQAAIKAGVRRFIFVSSIKVNGEKTVEKPFTERDEPQPEDAYGITKWEAEQALQKITTGSALQKVVLRAPLLYGAGVKGNLLRLMRAVDRGVPLPLASIHNRRSLLYSGNLLDAIILCLDHADAANQTYVLADDTGVSTPDIIRGIAQALGKPARLLPFPPGVLRFAGIAAGKADATSRLLESLQVDSSKIRHELGWLPRCDMARGLHEMARWYYQMGIG